MTPDDERERPKVDSLEQGEAKAEIRGLRMSDLVLLPDDWCKLLRWLIRRRRSDLTAIEVGMGWERAAAVTLLDRLIAEGYVRRSGDSDAALYEVVLARQQAQDATRGLLRHLGDPSGD